MCRTDLHPVRNVTDMHYVLRVCNLRPNDVDTCFIFLTHYKSGVAEVLSLFRLQCLKTTDVR